MKERIIPESKTCSRCHEVKPAAAFSLNPHMKLGLASACRACDNAASSEAKRRRRLENPRPTRVKKISKARSREEVHRKTKERRIANPIKSLLQMIRSRCNREGIPFDLTPEDFTIPERCPALGIPLIYNPQHNVRPQTGLSFDRIIPSKGYVKGNVRIISFRANRIKSDASLEELKALLDYVVRFKPTNLPPLAEGAVGHVPRKKATKQ